MNSCKEFNLDDVLAITAIPLAGISASTVDSPVNNLTPIIPEEDFNPSLGTAIVIGLQPATTGGKLIPIRRMTGKVKDEESDGVAGRMHTVNVTCEVDDRDEEVWESLAKLENTPCHLLLTFRGGTRAFVSATEDTYLCNTERDGAKTSVAFRIQNLTGVQLLVESSVDSL